MNKYYFTTEQSNYNSIQGFSLLNAIINFQKIRANHKDYSTLKKIFRFDKKDNKWVETNLLQEN